MSSIVPPLLYIATTKDGVSFPVECRPEPRYLHPEYEAVAYVAGAKARLFLDSERRPAVELTPALAKQVLNKELKKGQVAAVALDRPFQEENAAMIRAANQAVSRQADELLAALPPQTLVYPKQFATSVGMSTLVALAGVADTLPEKILKQRLVGMVETLALRYHLADGCESTFEHEPLTVESILARAAEIRAAKQQQEAVRQQHRQQVEQDELFVWDEDKIYSSSSHEMLHSLGATFSQKNQYIGVYTTQHCRAIPGARSTYDLRSELAGQGFVFDKPSSQWRLPYSDECAATVLAFLRQHGAKAWPDELGMDRCWECGRFSRNLDSDGYCGC